MLHGAAKLLTLFSVLFHAGMGCCAHHDHRSSGLRADATETQEQEPPKRHPCHCSIHAPCSADAVAVTEGESTEPAHSGCPCRQSHSGCSDHCSWLTTARVELPAEEWLSLPIAAVDGFAWNASGPALVACAQQTNPPLLFELTDSVRARTQAWRL